MSETGSNYNPELEKQVDVDPKAEPLSAEEVLRDCREKWNRIKDSTLEETKDLHQLYLYGITTHIGKPIDKILLEQIAADNYQYPINLTCYAIAGARLHFLGRPDQSPNDIKANYIKTLSDRLIDEGYFKNHSLRERTTIKIINQMKEEAIAFIHTMFRDLEARGVNDTLLRSASAPTNHPNQLLRPAGGETIADNGTLLQPINEELKEE